MNRTGDAVFGPGNVKRIYLVGSGKGGVGKSTISVNIAAALSHRGNRVGILDADICGPSIPLLLGAHGTAQMQDGEPLLPVEAYGMRIVSMGSLMPRESAIAWSGRTAGKAVRRFVRHVDWGGLDFLIVDLPPGTGDIQITVAKELKPDGALIVTTPHQVSREDVRRCINLFENQKIPIVGLVENMVSWACGKCGYVHSFFNGLADRWCHIETIAVLPMDRGIWESSKKGIPLAFDPAGFDSANTFDRIAARLEGTL